MCGVGWTNQRMRAHLSSSKLARNRLDTNTIRDIHNNYIIDKSKAKI